MGLFGLGRSSPPGVPPMGAMQVFGAGAPTSAVSLGRRIQAVPGEDPNEGEPWWKPLLPVLIAGGLSLGQQIWQNKREDSAHQREMKDLEAAGLNPALAAAGQGAQTGKVDVVGSALQLQRAKAEIDLIKAQTMQQSASAFETTERGKEIATFAPGRGDETQARIALMRGNLDEIRERIPQIKELALAEIRGKVTSAQLTEIETLLRGTQLENARNLEALAERMGIMGPALQLLIQMSNALRR